MGSHFGVGEITTQFRTYFGGDWDAYWGYGILVLTHGHVFPPVILWMDEILHHLRNHGMMISL